MGNKIKYHEDKKLAHERDVERPLKSWTCIYGMILSSLAGQLLYFSKINSKSNVECQRDRADYAESEKKKIGKKVHCMADWDRHVHTGQVNVTQS